MHILVMVVLAASPGESPKPLLREDAWFLVDKVYSPEVLAKFESAEARLFKVCSDLFADCREAQDEFQRRRAMESHRKELEVLGEEVRKRTTVVMGGVLCLGTYDFKRKGFPLNNLELRPPGTRTGSVPAEVDYLYPSAFVPEPASTNLVKELKLDEAAAERLKRLANPLCLTVRAEVDLPKNKIGLPKAPRRRMPMTDVVVVGEPDQPTVPVVLRKVELLNAAGERVAAY